MSIDAEAKQKWLAALRSGHYQQAKGALRKGDLGFCCLGVLADVLEPSRWFDHADFGWQHEGCESMICDHLAEDIGLENHVRYSLKPQLFTERFAGRSFVAIGDPSGEAKNSVLEETSFDTLRRLGIPAVASITNDIDARIRAVDQLLLGQSQGGPALLISQAGCPRLVDAMNGMYRYAKTKQGQTKPTPEKKHPWSDLADCLQYVALIVNAGMTQYIARKIRPRARPAQSAQPSSAGWT